MAKYIDGEKITSEISNIKKFAKFENSEFMTGYITALTAIEVMLAQLPIVEIKEETQVVKNEKQK